MWSSIYERSLFKLLTHEADLALAAIALLIHRYFDMSPTYWQTSTAYVSRQPLPVTSYGNITLPFSLEVWIASTATALALAVFFFAAHSTLGSEGLRHLGLVRAERFPSNFFIFSFAKVTEPGLRNLYT